ncbi:hypothetical protein DSM112329_04016 [Paraconexibacter sp. AEG42_29]|uniref:Subtilisin inhibitor domain-containing protein n=1 Tax=Paraconexibacter sp. AEG42_29 TaxID=2997339 RepID=A0AAU7AZI6_9ACTN
MPAAAAVRPALLLLATAIAVAVATVVAVATLTTTAAGAAAKPVVRLTVTYDAGPQAAARTATVRCGRKATATGFLRTTATRACRVARAQAKFLGTKPARDRACTLIYGGPQTGRVRGTIGSRKVDRAFSRADGCQIADWTTVEGLLPRTPGAAAP